MKGIKTMTRNRLPFGVSARFLNLAGAFVDVTGPVLVGWKCGGCPAGRSGVDLDANSASREAQNHALLCTALPGGR